MNERAEWVAVGNYRSGLEADMAVNLLEAEGIPAHSSGNDSVGIVGFGFQGSTARGFDVLVPSPLLAAARAVLDSTGSVRPS